MSQCLRCIARGPKPGCRTCAIPAPLPLQQRVRQFIESAAKEHRARQSAEMAAFNRDIRGLKDKYQEQLDRQKKYRRKKSKEAANGLPKL